VQPVPDLACHHEPVRHGNLPARSEYNSIVVAAGVGRLELRAAIHAHSVSRGCDNLAWKMDHRCNQLPVNLGQAVARRSGAKKTAAANSRAIEISLART
jgi:hypothetical protein